MDNFENERRRLNDLVEESSLKAQTFQEHLQQQMSINKELESNLSEISKKFEREKELKVNVEVRPSQINSDYERVEEIDKYINKELLEALNQKMNSYIEEEEIEDEEEMILSLKELTQAVDLLSNNVNDFKEKFNEKINNEYEIMKGQAQEAVDQLNYQKGLYEKALSDQEQSEKDFKLLNEKFNASMNECKEFQGVINSNKEEISSLQEALTLKEKAINEINLSSDSKKESMESLRKQIKEHESYFSELKSQIMQLERSLKTQEEIANTKQKELENRIIQERLKLDSKNKEYIKLDESYKEMKSSLQNQAEESNNAKEKVRVFELRLSEAKKSLKDLKHRARSLNEQLTTSTESSESLKRENQDLKDLLEKKIKYEATEQPIHLIKTESKHYYKLGIEKDILIKGLELKFSDLESKIKEQEEEIFKLQIEKEDLQSVFSFIIILG